ncbi:uncharacterized protein PGTG_12440 [Puccinia graminis f. sp. tritici CRL 75-36-700-3]|uniref:Xylanolytic transcriptional activator regulatory domain-containing protein n=1 Tax=Puccinia graminis f. sp. tritici (strain CRL 75-36-700-3 / race SCCL) TaxID=418459 RepID=E3KQA9_PUCGT|nr:uncharacterized protein PGTG_12440 [Puccinia graminis f. sp. tritici CRL 75-36-700-3]EFP86484.2 hypothetical protein PGTG_12440 [Puccinia graminis f. sp. tritici CRL 75-36-700-3]
MTKINPPQLVDCHILTHRSFLKIIHPLNCLIQLGPTAIAPGAPFREISLKLVRESGSKVPQTARPTNLDRMVPPTAAVSTPNSSQLNCTPAQLAADFGHDSSFNLTEEQFRRNADVFYDHMGSYLGCIRKEDLLQSLSQGKASEALKLAISALAECIRPSSTTVDYAEICSRRAKLLCLPHLSLPSLDTTFTLLLLAYCEFGREKDSGLWMWSGLAFRMATDLGLHKSSSAIQEPSSVSSPTATSWDQSEAGLRQRIFWSCYHLDRLISSGTGRVATLLDSEIEIDLPSLQAITSEDPLHHHQLLPSPSQEALLSPFHHLTQILILVGKISDAFNRSKLASHSSSSPPSPSSEPEAKTLEHFRTELHDFYTRLPPVLHFTVDIARRHISVKNGPAFLLLHLWFHSLVIITHNPNSVGPGWSSLDVGPMDPLLLEISQGSVRTISDMIAFANVVDPDIVPSLPFASQPILIAGLASIPSQSSQPPNQRPIQAADWREFEICSAALQKMQTRWRGVGWLVSTLHSRARNEQDVDLSSSGGAEVSTADNSLMNKLLVRKAEPELLNPICFSHSNESHHFVGLSATGTFHEPASGRLSLVHQPEICCSSSEPTDFTTHNEEQKWTETGAMGQPVVNQLGGLKLTVKTEGEPVQGSLSGKKHQEHSADLGPTLDSTDYNLQPCPAIKPSHQAGEKFIGAVVGKEDVLSPGPQASSASSYWVTQPIPQIFWPNLPSLEVLNHHKPGGPTYTGLTDENHQVDKDSAVTDQPITLSNTSQTDGGCAMIRVKEIENFQQSNSNVLNPFILHADNHGDNHHHHHQHQHHPHLHPLQQQQQQPPPPLEQQQQQLPDHILGLPEFFEHQSHPQQSPSPVFAKEVWDHLFRGEVGIWSSFHHF